MKIKEIENSKIAALLGYNIVLYPFVLYVGVPTERVRKHEMAHVEQIKQWGVLNFYRLYIMFYVGYRMAGMSHEKAYRNIPFEVEAREKETQ